MIRLLQLVGSLAALALGLHLLKWHQLLAGASRIDVASFALALALALGSIAATGLRWIYMVRQLVAVPVREHWRIYCLATFFNSFTPANIGGDVYRVVVLRPWLRGQGVSALIAAVTVERILGLASFFFGYLMSLAVYAVTERGAVSKLGATLLYPAVPVALALAVIAVLPILQRAGYWLPVPRRYPRFARQMQNFEDGVRLATTRNLVALAGLSVLAWIAWVATVSVVAARLGLQLPISLLALIVSFTEVVRLIPVSLQGIGVREGVFAVLVGMAGGLPAVGFVVAAVAYVALSLALVVAGLLGGLLGLTSSWRGAAGEGLRSPDES